MEELFAAILKNLLGKNFPNLATDFLSQYSSQGSQVGGILSGEILSDIQRVLKEEKLKDAVDMIQQALSAAENASLNVAVIGESGTGKSSFINALRGLGPEEEGSAKVGVVETTMKATPYQHPKYPKATFWDLPGTGTPKFNPDTYLETVEFSRYDFFLVISSFRFTVNDAMLAQKITEVGKRFYFLRSKVDSDLYNEQRSKPRTFQRDRVLQQIRDNCLINLNQIGIPDLRIFLISNFDVGDFDFPILEQTLLQDLPAHKRHAFALLLPNACNVYIDMKKEFLQQKILLEATKAAIIAFLPVVPFFNGFDEIEQEKCLKLYRDYFGLDDKSIEEIAQKLGTTVGDIKSSMKSMDFWTLVRDDSVVAKAKSCAECLCSVNGGFPSAVFQFLKNYSLRLKFLDTVAEDAKLLLSKLK